MAETRQAWAAPVRLTRRRALLGLGALALAACSRPVTYSQPEPGFLRYHADDIVQALRAAGLSVVQVAPKPIATPTPDPGRPRPPRVAGRPPSDPMVEVEARTFAIDGLGGKGGEIFIFDSRARLRAKQIWFARFPDLYPYVYTRENVLLRLDAALPPEQAERYKEALERLP